MNVWKLFRMPAHYNSRFQNPSTACTVSWKTWSEDFLPCVFPFLPVNSLLLFLMCLHFSLPAHIISCAKPAHDQHSSLAEHMHVFFSLALILSFNRNFCNVNNNSVNFLFSSFGYNKLIKTKERCQTAA